MTNIDITYILEEAVASAHAEVRKRSSSAEVNCHSLKLSQCTVEDVQQLMAKVDTRNGQVMTVVVFEEYSRSTDALRQYIKELIDSYSPFTRPLENLRVVLVA